MIRRRKKHSIDIASHDRWLVSYADFVTLLFAFFVVMYSISAVNEEKYKAFSSSLESAFLDKSRAGQTPIETADAKTAVSDKKAGGFDLTKEKKQLQNAMAQLVKSLKPLIDDNRVSISKKDHWIELELSSGLFFASGEAELSSDSKPLIQNIADVFKPLPNAIHVEGHTDINPINTLKFPSNWELSSARATRVVQEFIREGIEPTRLSAIGYGEFHPVSDNRTEQGRFKNRRVVLLLVSQGFSRYGVDNRATND
ncbi:MAG: flagellar motor protein MotD [Gammaproteobacteria bacterium]